jgi:hypothetical protein
MIQIQLTVWTALLQCVDNVTGKWPRREGIFAGTNTAENGRELQTSALIFSE